jgi:osmotically inducible lipoprotein OsmB
MSAVSLQMTLIISLVLGVGACTMNETAQRTGSGAAIGAAAGALLGGRSGAAWGAAVGAGGGYLVDQTKKRESTEAENQRLREENYRLQQQAQ